MPSKTLSQVRNQLKDLLPGDHSRITDSFTTHVYPSVEVDQLVSLLRMQAEENVSEDCGKLALILERKVFLSRLKQSFPQLRLFVRKGFRIFLRSLSWVSYRRI